jgi:thiamine-monophosphate kinase
LIPPKVSEISEFALIQRLSDALPERARTSPRTMISIGDDGAVAGIATGELMVVTTDALNQGIHFRPDWTDWETIGRKAIAVNLSDLAAMGAAPLLLTVSLALTGQERVADLEAMYAGMGKVAVAHQAVIAGGDITRTSGSLSIVITAIGETLGKRIMRRDGAQPNDVIWVTGQIGAAAAGLALEMMEPGDPRLSASTAAQLKAALHNPVPRCAAGRALAAIGVICGMDLSDGLSGDLMKILFASGVDAELNLADLPIAASVRAIFRSEALELAIHGAEDYELLITAPESLSSRIRETLDLTGTRVTAIGRILEQAGPEPRIVGIEPIGFRRTIQPDGFDHFGNGR